MSPRTVYTPGQVLAAVREYAASRKTGTFTSRQVQMDVVAKFHAGTHVWDAPLESQILRAANKLAGTGELIKIARHEYGPDGRRVYRWPDFWTPAAYAAAQVKYEEDQLARRRSDKRWAGIRDSLDDLGISPLGGSAPQLTQDQWEQLIALAAWGKVCQPPESPAPFLDAGQREPGDERERGKGRPYLLYKTRNGQHLWEGPFTAERRVHTAAAMNRHVLEAGTYTVAWEPRLEVTIGDSPLPLADAGVEAEAMADAAETRTMEAFLDDPDESGERRNRPIRPADWFVRDRGKCPDDGTCHHGCSGPERCLRVEIAAPLSGSGWEHGWPPEVRAAHLPSDGHI